MNEVADLTFDDAMRAPLEPYMVYIIRARILQLRQDMMAWESDDAVARAWAMCEQVDAWLTWESWRRDQVEVLP